MMGPLRHHLAPCLLLVLAGCGGGGGDSLPEVEGPTRPALDVEASDMRFDPDRIAVADGSIRVVLRNVGQVVHDIRIDGMPRLLVEARPGQTGEGTWELEEGRYTIYCSIEGHREAGMEGVLEVRSQDGS